MKSRFLRPKALAATIATVLAGSAITAITSLAAPAGAIDDAPTASRGTVVNLATATSARYIVRFVEPPLASYNAAASSGASISGVSKIPTKTMPNGRVRLDVHSSAAATYVQYVKNQQTLHLSDIATALNQTVPVRYSMQHALNAVVMELTPKQAQAVSGVPGVVAVERDYPHPLATDIGPGFIGASSVWWGTPAGQDSFFANGFDNSGGFFGDGIVVGDIDTGYNSKSPSFQATDGDGYTVTNPLGSGNFIGQCDVSGISLGGCNDKVIGVYDEIDLTGSDNSFNGHYSVEDTQGHGSHTASTAAGNQRMGTIAGYTARLSGVAPHANLVVYYACSPNVNIQCSSAATSASVDQAIQDGVVDALNFSISGGTAPWQDSTSLAFLAASDAGIFVAAAAGNTSATVPAQVPGTANHAEPWVTSVAAGTHTGGTLAVTLSATGPGTPPANVQNQPVVEVTGDKPATGDVTGTLKISPLFNASNTTGNDGCSAYTANFFAGDIALVSRGTCNFSVKVVNAVAAGATAVVISDNRVEPPLNITVADVNGNQAVPVYALTQAEGLAFQSFLSANGGAVPATIPYPFARQSQKPDVLANFSLLGPVNTDVIKPDVQAPGVAILAAFANSASDSPNLIAFDDGTSMATPHTTGSGALMLGLHPDWSPQEARSALMMTAKEAGLTKADGTTPSDYFDRGSGRLQDYPASNTGLVLDETGLNFINADPSNSGSPSSLNLASMQSAECIDACSFTRKFHSTQDHTVTWTPSVAPGSDAQLAVTFGSSSFPATAHHDTAPITFNVNSHAVTSDGKFHFAEVILTPSDSSLTPLHLPIAVAVPPPTITAQPNPLSITGVGATSATSTLTVSNVGGPTLNVTQNTTTASTPKVWNNQPSNDTFGYTSVQYSGRGADDTDFFASDDFTITGGGSVNLTQIRAPGFFQSASSTATLANTATAIHWRIYTDAGGHPSSDPDTGGAAVFAADLAPNAPGVSLNGGTYHAEIDLNLTTAGLSTNLPAGHYWMVVYATLPCADTGNGCVNSWLWLNSTTGSGSSAVNIAPQSSTPTWTTIDSTAGAGFAMHLESNVSCVPPAWLSVMSGLPAAIDGDASAPVVVKATGPLPSSSATAYLCLSSNDTKTPLLPVQVNAAQ